MLALVIGNVTECFISTRNLMIKLPVKLVNMYWKVENFNKVVCQISYQYWRNALVHCTSPFSWIHSLCHGHLLFYISWSVRLQGLPPFQWSTSGLNGTHYGQVLTRCPHFRRRTMHIYVKLGLDQVSWSTLSYPMPSYETLLDFQLHYVTSGNVLCICLVWLKLPVGIVSSPTAGGKWRVIHVRAVEAKNDLWKCCRWKGLTSVLTSGVPFHCS